VRREGSEGAGTGQGFTVPNHGKTVRTDRREVRAFSCESSTKVHDYFSQWPITALILQYG